MGRRVHVQSTGQVGGARRGVEPGLVGQTGPRAEQPPHVASTPYDERDAAATRVIASVGA